MGGAAKGGSAEPKGRDCNRLGILNNCVGRLVFSTRDAPEVTKRGKDHWTWNRPPGGQTAEIQIRVALVNRFNALGTAEFVCMA